MMWEDRSQAKTHILSTQLTIRNDLVLEAEVWNQPEAVHLGSRSTESFWVGENHDWRRQCLFTTEEIHMQSHHVSLFCWLLGILPEGATVLVFPYLQLIQTRGTWNSMGLGSHTALWLLQSTIRNQGNYKIQYVGTQNYLKVIFIFEVFI